MTVEKPKPKQLFRPITTRTNTTMNQSQFIAIICDSLKARQKSRVRGAIGSITSPIQNEIKPSAVVGQRSIPKISYSQLHSQC